MPLSAPTYPPARPSSPYVHTIFHAPHCHPCPPPTLACPITAPLPPRVSPQGTTVEAGTVVVTGTPGGVGYTRHPPILLQDGDNVTISISGIGSLTNIIQRNTTAPDALSPADPAVGSSHGAAATATPPPLGDSEGGVVAVPDQYFYSEALGQQHVAHGGCILTVWDGTDPDGVKGYPSLTKVECAAGKRYKASGINLKGFVRVLLWYGSAYVSGTQLRFQGEAVWVVGGAHVDLATSVRGEASNRSPLATGGSDGTPLPLALVAT